VPPLPVYTGPFGPEQAERLLWRAGFGPRGGEDRRLAAKGLHAAVESLIHPAAQDRLVGKPPTIDGHALAPKDAYGHDHLWWLDRMVRTSRPLVERMTLVWHDWFATSNETVGNQRLMLQQNELFRQIGLGSFEGLTMRVTINPAMLLYLNGLNSLKGAPNENYAREMMELFTLGAGNGYTERDVREQARALTGWTADYQNGYGWKRFRFKRENHDDAMKVVLGKVGPFNWKSAVRLAIDHPKHPAYFVNKLWGYFVPLPPDAATATALQQLYVHSGHQIRPVVAAILRHPLLYEGPRMVKSPAVYTAGLLRARGDRIETEDWIWLDAMAGQQLFYPPNVSGWKDDRWLDTSTFRARWLIAGRALQKHAFNAEHAGPGDRPPADPALLVEKALGWWGGLRVSDHTRGALLAYAQKTMAAAVADDGRQKSFPLMTYNALRHLVAVSPEMQTA
jgi:uncharacterized protein (DUF1800 family)